MINGGRWQNRRKWSKFGQILHEFQKIRTIVFESEKWFSKIVNRGGGPKRRKLLKITLGVCEYHNQSQLNGHSNFLLNSNMKGRVKSWAS